MKRRRRRSSSVGMSMDSFLDIVSNSLGLLILILTFTVITSGSVRVDLGTPLSRPPADDLTHVDIECVRGQAFVLPDLAADPPADGSYEIQRGFDDIVLHLDPEAVGVTLNDLERGGPSSRGVLFAGLNPDRQWIHFIVRDDSFDVFRQARRAASEQGFETGWTPWPTDRALAFGPGGTPRRKD